MMLAHLTHEELPVLVALAVIGAGVGLYAGMRIVLRAIARRRGS